MNKKIIVLILLLTNIVFGGFNFGECSGSKTFKQLIQHYNGDYENVVIVGSIPQGIEGLRVELFSDKDVDIRLYGQNSDKIIHWPYGILNSATLQTKQYKNVDITYSGYNGIGSNHKGHEFIEVAGTTPTTMIMKAFGFESGYATVNYSWTGKKNCKVPAKGEGNFKQAIKNSTTSVVGSIPKDVKNIEINLTSSKDIDIQLYGEDGTVIVAWKPKGLLFGSGFQSIEYHGMHIEWSGYNGVNGKKGHEYIRVTPETTESLTMKVYGYEKGFADVRYQWGKSIDNNDKIAPIITLLGDTNIVLYQGMDYTDAGASAQDNLDGNITAKIKVDNSVNINKIGKYSVTYNVTDKAGNSAIEKKRVIQVLSKIADEDGDGILNFVETSMKLNPLGKESLPFTSEEDKKIQHILNRFSYGSNKELLESVAQKGGIEGWLQDQLNNPQTTFPNAGEDIAQDKLDNYYATKQMLNKVFPYVRPLHSKHQVQAVMGSFWFNHFNTEGKNLVLEMAEDNDKFYFNSLGNFRTLLGISAKSAAMSYYLDGNYNVIGAINENYAREIMELHTLGIESYNKVYTQHDIQALARIFTGWSVKTYRGESNLYRYKWKKRKRKPNTKQYIFKKMYQNKEVIFRANKHDKGTKTFLKQSYTNTGKKEGEDALDVLAYHPNTASLICKKLAQKIVSDKPSIETINRCKETFINNKYADNQIAEVLHTLVQTDEFKNAYRQKVKDTQEYLLSLARILELDATKVPGNATKGRARSIGGFINKATKQPFWGKLEPTGWSEVSSAWDRSNTVIDRMQAVHALLYKRSYSKKSLLKFFQEEKGLVSPKDILSYLLPIMTGGFYDGKELQKAYEIVCSENITSTCHMTEESIKLLLEYLAANVEFNLQ